MKKYLTVALVLCLLLAVLGACGKGGPSKDEKDKVDPGDITVVFIPKITGNAFFEEANNGAQAYAAKQGFKVDYQGSPKADVADQVKIVRDSIDKKVNAICISSLDAAQLDGVLKEAMEAGIKVTTWDSDVSGDARSIMVSQGTPEQLGKMLVEMGAKSLSDRGKDPNVEPIQYAWHYSQATVTDQNSWQVAGEAYIKETYPKWKNLNPSNYYSDQDPEKALKIGKKILKERPDIDLIICNDSTALPGQAEAAKEMGLTAEDVTITGFASPKAMRAYCEEGIVTRWGLWDCQVQGALGCYLAYYLAAGNELHVGDKVNVPDVDILEVMPNTVLDPDAYVSPDSGVVLLPDRLEFTIDNVDKYNY